MPALDVSSGTDAPATHAFAISPGDGSDLAYVTRALYAGVTGTVKVTMFSGDVVTLVGFPAGIPIPIRVKRVWATDTTATSIVGFY